MRGRFEAISASATSFVGPGISSPGGIERENTEAGAMDKAPVAEADKLTSAEEVVGNPFSPHYLETSALIGFGRETRSIELRALMPTRIVGVSSPTECHRNPRVVVSLRDAVRTRVQNVAWAPDLGRSSSPER